MISQEQINETVDYIISRIKSLDIKSISEFDAKQLTFTMIKTNVPNLAEDIAHQVYVKFNELNK